MGRARKRAKLMDKEDRLSQLPDEILSTIVSLLAVKDAVTTCVLSKRWRYIWASHSELCFDSLSILGVDAHLHNKLYGQAQRQKFVERVDHFMNHRFQGLDINSFALRFHLGKVFFSHINQWVRFAVTNGVKNIDLDLSKCCSSNGDATELYELDCLLLVPHGRKCTLKHLHLASCIFSVPSSFNVLSSLITLKLQEVCVCDQQLKNLLSNCLLLEELSLHACQDLFNLNFSSPSTRMKFLSIRLCTRLGKVQIAAENLRTFEYAGPCISLSFKHVPELSQAFLCFTGPDRLNGVTYALTRLAHDVPHLEKLNLISVLSIKDLVLPTNCPAFTNVKELAMTICPFDDDDKLSWMSHILNDFPMLQKLEFNLFSPSFIKLPKEVDRLLAACPHKHLAELEINGFCGNLHEIELLGYLLDNLVALKVLVIGSGQKVYKGFNNWVYEEAPSWYKEKLQLISQSLVAAVPPNVYLEVR